MERDQDVNLIEYPDSDMMMIDLAQRIAGELGTCLLEHEIATFAVPGGSTPGPMYDALSAADIDWARVHVLLTDERRVPADHPRSNERLVRERLLTGRASKARFIRYVPHGEADGADDEGMSRLIDDELPISILLLGMGADMHTASLFPGSPDLAAALSPNAPNVMSVRPPGDDLEPRVTLTARVLTNAMATHLLITGEDKRKALERARDLAPEEAPVALVLAEADVHWAP